MKKREMNENFLGKKCVCGNPKAAMRSFCGSCYHSLPPDLKQNLYRKFNFGYEDAFNNAVKYLNDKKQKESEYSPA